MSDIVCTLSMEFVITDEQMGVIQELTLDRIIYGYSMYKIEGDKIIRIPPEDWDKFDAT